MAKIKHICQYISIGWNKFDSNKDAWYNEIIEKCSVCSKTRTRRSSYQEYDLEIERITCKKCDSIHDLIDNKDLCIKALNKKIQDLKNELESRIETLEYNSRHPDNDY